MVDHKHAARALTVAGVDIYHPTQDELTGAEISYGGDSTRSLKADNYFCSGDRGTGIPRMGSLRRTASSAGIQSSGFRGKYGGILALAFDPQFF